MILKTQVGSYEITVEGANMEEVFDQMAEASELLSHGVKCGKTGNPDTIMRRRQTSEYTFYEFFCPESGAALALGRTKNGNGFFPKTKDKAGNFLPHKGWLTFKERKELQEGAKPAAAGADDFPTNF